MARGLDRGDVALDANVVEQVLLEQEDESTQEHLAQRDPDGQLEERPPATGGDGEGGEDRQRGEHDQDPDQLVRQADRLLGRAQGTVVVDREGAEVVVQGDAEGVADGLAGGIGHVVHGDGRQVDAPAEDVG